MLILIKYFTSRVQVLSNMVDNMGQLKSVSGVQSIPFMQVILRLILTTTCK